MGSIRTFSDWERGMNGQMHGVVALCAHHLSIGAAECGFRRSFLVTKSRSCIVCSMAVPKAESSTLQEKMVAEKQEESSCSHPGFLLC